MFRTLRVAVLLLAALGTSAVAQPSARTRAPSKAVVIHSPPPPYPASAKMRGATGAGIFVMRVQIKTGIVKGVGVVRSTGHRDLDAAAMAGLTYWRFQPGACPSIRETLPHTKDPLADEDALVRTPVAFRR